MSSVNSSPGRTVPLWSMFTRVKDVGHPNEPMLSVYREHGVVLKEGRSDNHNKTAENRNIYQLVDPGWLVINRMKAWQGAVGISSYRGIVSGHYICFRPHHSENSRFLNYLFRSLPYTALFTKLSRGVRPSQIEIDNDGLQVLPVVLPEHRKQHLIADHLDRETSRFEALIAKKRRMIELLLEHESALTDELVWRTPYPQVPLKRLVPEDRKIMYGIVLPGENMESGVLLVKGGDVKPGRLRPDLLSRTDVEIERRYVRSRLKAGDLLFAIRGGIGDVEITPPTISGANITQDVARISPGPQVDPSWLLYALRSTSTQRDVLRRITGATIRGINIEELERIQLPLPPLSVQREVVEHLQRKLTPSELIRNRLRRQADLLTEHRQALITAAVTGELELPGAA